MLPQLYVVIEESKLKLPLEMIAQMNNAQRVEYLTEYHLEDIDYLGSKKVADRYPTPAQFKSVRSVKCRYWYLRLTCDIVLTVPDAG